MKKQLLSLVLLMAGFTLLAQNQRMALFEEFTGETCPPCAATNPGLDALLKSGTNPTKIIPIKWQVPIPSAPTPTWSLYRTNKAEIDWRYASYGYGINSAPSARIDGQNCTVFGMASDHPANLNNTVINTAYGVTTPFAITMTRAWDPTFSSVSLTVNIVTSGTFAATGDLRCRVVLIENEINFPTQPGTNGEKDFNWPVRKSYPDIQNGTDIPDTWTNAQSQQFVLNCALPSYINDKAQVAFVAFIQDDGNRIVWQAAKTNPEPVQNDAKAISASINSVVCTSTVPATAQIMNNGSNAITAMTLVPTMDGVAGTAVNWTGNLAAGATTNVPLGNTNVTTGGHSFSVNVTGVNAGDFNVNNNKVATSFIGATSYQSQQVMEGFTAAAFPPANWGRYNPSNGSENWVRVANAGFGNMESSKMAFYDISAGTIMDLVLPPMNLSGSQSPLMTFDVAYRQYSAAYNDRLQVLLSTDCGANWSVVYDKAGSALNTAGISTSAFTPNSDSQWRNESVELVGQEGATTAIVKFRATSAYGNNLYLDNVNLMQADPTGVNEVRNDFSSVSLFPNPSRGATTLRVNANVSTNATLSVTNVLGQVVYSNKLSLEAGENNININAAELASGVYNVVLESNSGKTVKKLSVN